MRDTPSELPGPGEAPGPPRADGPGEPDDTARALLAGVTYGVLFVLGVLLGVVGGLGHSWFVGDKIPVAAIGWLAALFAVSYGMGRLMDTRLGAFVPALGWGLVSAVFAVQRSEGDLVIAANAAGYAYLYGGMAVVAAAVLLVPSSGSWLLTPGFGASPPDGPRDLPR